MNLLCLYTLVGKTSLVASTGAAAFAILHLQVAAHELVAAEEETLGSWDLMGSHQQTWLIYMFF